MEQNKNHLNHIKAYDSSFQLEITLKQGRYAKNGQTACIRELSQTRFHKK